MVTTETIKQRLIQQAPVFGFNFAADQYLGPPLANVSVFSLGKVSQVLKAQHEICVDVDSASAANSLGEWASNLFKQLRGQAEQLASQLLNSKGKSVVIGSKEQLYGKWTAFSDTPATITFVVGFELNVL